MGFHLTISVENYRNENIAFVYKNYKIESQMYIPIYLVNMKVRRKTLIMAL
jgi:hypothetical protein